MDKAILSKAGLARSLGIARSSLYYVSRQEKKDRAVKARIEEELREHPAYGSRSLCLALHFCRQKIQRVMRKFGIKHYRRVSRKWRRKSESYRSGLRVIHGPLCGCSHFYW